MTVANACQSTNVLFEQCHVSISSCWAGHWPSTIDILKTRLCDTHQTCQVAKAEEKRNVSSFPYKRVVTNTASLTSVFSKRGSLLRLGTIS